MSNARPRKTYTRANFRVPAASADEAAGMLVASGALGCAVAGMSRPGQQASPIVTLEAYFDRVSATGLRRISEALTRAGMLAEANRNGFVRRISDPGWSTIWMKRFGPFHLGRRFLIAPPWSRLEEKDRIRIVINAAQGFGTGHHPTTAGAMRAIERLCSKRRFRSALDVGAGSGILSIAIGKLGVPRVMGIDIDRAALANARENAKLNSLKTGVEFPHRSIGSIHKQFDLIVANILSTTLVELAPLLKRALARDGRLVLGGMLASEAEGVLPHYRPELRCVRISEFRKWTTAVLAR
ncbi:MAG TPA: 50S ribosomal protein L11 methyltransferase [Candidatus Binataceae bacterium]